MSKITPRAGLSLVAAAAAALMIDAFASTAVAQSGQFRLGSGPSAIPFQAQPVQPALPRVLRRGHYYGPGSAPRPNQFGQNQQGLAPALPMPSFNQWQNADPRQRFSDGVHNWCIWMGQRYRC